MKKLEKLFEGQFTSLESNQMHSLYGGAEKPTELREGATIKKYGAGCSQADKNENDKQTLVGDVICGQDTIKGVSFVLEPESISGDVMTYDIIDTI